MRRRRRWRRGESPRLSRAACLPRRSFGAVDLRNKFMQLIAPNTINLLAVEASAEAQIFEMRKRLREREPFLVEHHVAPEQVAGHVHRGHGSAFRDGLDTAPQTQLVV